MAQASPSAKSHSQANHRRGDDDGEATDAGLCAQTCNCPTVGMEAEDAGQVGGAGGEELDAPDKLVQDQTDQPDASPEGKDGEDAVAEEPMDEDLFASMLSTVLGPSTGVFGALDEGGMQEAPAEIASSAASKPAEAVPERTILHCAGGFPWQDWRLGVRLRLVSSLPLQHIARAGTVCGDCAGPSMSSVPEPIPRQSLLSAAARLSGTGESMSTLYEECLSLSSSAFGFWPAPAPETPAHLLLGALVCSGLTQALQRALTYYRYPATPMPRSILVPGCAAADSAITACTLTAAAGARQPTLHLPPVRATELGKQVMQRRLAWCDAFGQAFSRLLCGAAADLAVMFADGNVVHFRQRSSATGTPRLLMASIAATTTAVRAGLRAAGIPFSTPLDPTLGSEHLSEDAEVEAELKRLANATGISVQRGVQASQRGLRGLAGYNVTLSQRMVARFCGGGGGTAATRTFSPSTVACVSGAAPVRALALALAGDVLVGGGLRLSPSLRAWLHGAPGCAALPSHRPLRLQGLGCDVPTIAMDSAFHGGCSARLALHSRGALSVPVVVDAPAGESRVKRTSTLHALDIVGPILPSCRTALLQAAAAAQAWVTVCHQAHRMTLPRPLRQGQVLAAHATAVQQSLPRLLRWLQAALQYEEGGQSTSAPPSPLPGAVALLEAATAAVAQACQGSITKPEPTARLDRAFFAALHRSIAASLTGTTPQPCQDPSPRCVIGQSREVAVQARSSRTGLAAASGQAVTTGGGVFGDQGASHVATSGVLSGIGGPPDRRPSAKQAAQPTNTLYGIVKPASKRGRSVASRASRVGGVKRRGGGVHSALPAKRSSSAGGTQDDSEEEESSRAGHGLSVGLHSSFDQDHGVLRVRLEAHPLCTLQASPAFLSGANLHATPEAGGSPLPHPGMALSPPVLPLDEVRCSLISRPKTPSSTTGQSASEPWEDSTLHGAAGGGPFTLHLPTAVQDVLWVPGGRSSAEVAGTPPPTPLLPAPAPPPPSHPSATPSAQAALLLPLLLPPHAEKGATEPASDQQASKEGTDPSLPPLPALRSSLASAIAACPPGTQHPLAALVARTCPALPTWLNSAVSMPASAPLALDWLPPGQGLRDPDVTLAAAAALLRRTPASLPVVQVATLAALRAAAALTLTLDCEVPEVEGGRTALGLDTQDA